MPPAMEVYTLTNPTLLDVEVVLKKVESDEELQKMIHMLKKDPNNRPKFHLQQVRLMYKD